MAATETRRTSLLALAALLPGVGAGGLLCGEAQAAPAPEQAVVAVKYLDYQDRQPGLQRTHVSAPSVLVQAPLSADWSLEASAVSDTVSGASPRFHTAISGASRQSERRQAADLTLRHHAPRSGWQLGAAASSEHDYQSRTVSAGIERSSDDNNQTWFGSVAYGSDRIGSRLDPTLREHRRTWQGLAGFSRNLSSIDVVQLNLSLSHGEGFFDDPYKLLDHRPGHRDQGALLLRWNHHFASAGASLRSSYRYYADSFGVRAHALEAEWVQALGERVRLSPSLRYASQRAASFYLDPGADGSPFPPGWQAGALGSVDQRLSGFGAITV
ncbi:MAG TPA: DUF3570 domain-containing protein, partial [Burkholderiaceae bacterium]|nr:DUF3570 domain-containing protein [Burkholderiaceae bacterium]